MKIDKDKQHEITRHLESATLQLTNATNQTILAVYTTVLNECHPCDLPGAIQRIKERVEVGVQSLLQAWGIAEAEYGRMFKLLDDRAANPVGSIEWVCPRCQFNNRSEVEAEGTLEPGRTVTCFQCGVWFREAGPGHFVCGDGRAVDIKEAVEQS